jgi:hypothetical protein
MYATIYHPRFEPDESWLRAMLLFYDTVHSIVPNGAGYETSPGVARLQDKVPEAFVPLAPDIEDRAVFSAEKGIWNRYHALTQFLDELGKGAVGAERVSAPFYVDRGVVHLTLDRAVAVHYDKLVQDFIHALTARDRAIEVEKPIDPVAHGTGPTARWLYVDKRIARLSLSILAERMRQRRSQIKHTSSDEALCFGVAVKSEMNEADQARWNREARRPPPWCGPRSRTTSMSCRSTSISKSGKGRRNTGTPSISRWARSRSCTLTASSPRSANSRRPFKTNSTHSQRALRRSRRAQRARD